MTRIRIRTDGIVQRLLLLLLLTAVITTEACSRREKLPVKLELDVSFKEQVFHLPRPVIAHVKFKNHSAVPAVINIAFNFLDHSTLDFRIVAPSGETLKRLMILQGKRPVEPGPRDFQKIRAGEVYEVAIDLAQWYELTEKGTYTVEAEYSNTYEGRQWGENVWTGRIKSPTRTFQLVKPHK